jgi:hypothetical protein
MVSNVPKEAVGLLAGNKGDGTLLQEQNGMEFFWLMDGMEFRSAMDYGCFF